MNLITLISAPIHIQGGETTLNSQQHGALEEEQREVESNVIQLSLTYWSKTVIYVKRAARMSHWLGHQKQEKWLGWLASFPLNLGPILDNSSGLWMAVCPPPFHQPTHYTLYCSPEANRLTTLLLCGLISCVWCELRTSFFVYFSQTNSWQHKSQLTESR